MRKKTPRGYFDFTSQPTPEATPNLSYNFNSRKERTARAVNKIGPSLVYVGSRAQQYQNKFNSKVEQGRKKIDEARNEVSKAFDQVHVDLSNSLDFEGLDFGNTIKKNKKDEDLISW